jgi:hypothetical protein
MGINEVRKEIDRRDVQETYNRRLADLGSPPTRFFLLQSLVLLGRPPLGLVVVIDALLVISFCLSFFIRLRFPSTSSW